MLKHNIVYFYKIYDEWNFIYTLIKQLSRKGDILNKLKIKGSPFAKNVNF